MDFLWRCIVSSILFIAPIILYCFKFCSKNVFLTIYGIILTIGIILPLIFHCSLTLQRAVLYFNFLDRPQSGKLKDLLGYGLPNARNFYIKNGNLSLGTWHILPKHYPEKNYSDEEFIHFLTKNEPIFIYFHGNSGSRGSTQRVFLYNMLRGLGYHVIAFDYRSYGDSTHSEPYEKALVSDSEAVAEWVFQHKGTSPVYFWGHSIGTGFTTNVAARLEKKGFKTNGVILENGFVNMPAEIQVHPFGTVFRIFPWYDYCFSKPYWTNDEDFLSSEYVLQFSAPILLLHSEDDNIIPWTLSKRLADIVLKKRPPTSRNVQLIIFGAEREYGHTNIGRAPELPEIIGNFAKSSGSQGSNN